MPSVTRQGARMDMPAGGTSPDDFSRARPCLLPLSFLGRPRNKADDQTVRIGQIITRVLRSN